MIRVFLLLPGVLALDHGGTVGMVGSHAPTTPVLPPDKVSALGSTGIKDASAKSRNQSSPPRTIGMGLHKELGFGLQPMTDALRQAVKAAYGEEPAATRRSSLPSLFLAPLEDAAPLSLRNASAEPATPAAPTDEVLKPVTERSPAGLHAHALVRGPGAEQPHEPADTLNRAPADTLKGLVKDGRQLPEALPGQAALETEVQETVQWLQRPVEIRMPRYHWVVIVCLALAVFFAARAYIEMFSVPRPWQKQSRVLDPPLFKGRAGAAQLGHWSPRSTAGLHASNTSGPAAGTDTPLCRLAGPGYDTMPNWMKSQRGG